MLLSRQIGATVNLASPQHTSTDQQQQQRQRQRQRQQLSNRVLSGMGHAIRCFCLEVPIWTSFGLLCLGILLECWRDAYWTRQFQMETWTRNRWDQEYTYYAHHCTVDDQTAFSIDDLVLGDEETALDAKERMLVDGAFIYPHVLSESTAQQVRNFIVKQNRAGKDMIHVIQNNHRFSFAIQVDQDPSIPKALQEILSNQRLVDALEAVVGPDPSVVEFTGITSEYGALAQEMHADVVPQGSAGRFARNFAPSYSLFIPLQNTTSRMGATYICPGTHMCFDGGNAVCDETAPQASGPRDNWPTGWGALVNQQTLHKGAAHVDPHGPERVLFIITFAPRPLFGTSKTAVETRILGTGGSYSLHWSQWGHTLSDFAQPQTYMTTPWRQLRALGLYKPTHRNWGWDFWTVTYQRIAQSELGYGNDYLLTAIDEGVLDWIPLAIRGPRSLYQQRKGVLLRKSQYDKPSSDEEEEEEGDDEDEEGGRPSARLAWKDFAEHVVLHFSIWAEQLYAWTLGTTIAVWIALRGVGFVYGVRTTSFWRPVRRLFLGHVAIALVAWLYYRSTESSTWARNIRQGLAFNTNLQDQSYLPDLPSTLVTPKDVLLSSEYQSEYMASFTEILDRKHEGNARFTAEVQASYAHYENWTPSLRTTLCQELLLRVAQTGGRFVTKNRKNHWSVLTQPMAMAHCDKVLQSEANPRVGFAVQWIAFLKSEFRFGYWRNTSALKSFTMAMLQNLESRVLHQNDMAKQPRPKDAQPNTVTPRLRSRLSALPKFQQQEMWRRRSILSLRPAAEEPYAGAWLQVGDVVEAKYQGMFNEWYKAMIVDVNVQEETWMVRYLDGEVESTGLCRGCVRRFRPFVTGEVVAWNDPATMYKDCEIIRYHPSDRTYDIRLVYQPSRMILGVQEHELRRGINPTTKRNQGKFTWNVGDRVVTFVPGEGPFLGEIVRMESRGQFEVQFDDGSIDTVPIEYIVGPEEEEEWKVGDQVAAKYPDMEEVFGGVITRVWKSSQEYTIEYDDGDVARVSRDLIVAPWDEWKLQ